jgi:hypothetical protein
LLMTTTSEVVACNASNSDVAVVDTASTEPTYFSAVQVGSFS